MSKKAGGLERLNILPLIDLFNIGVHIRCRCLNTPYERISAPDSHADFYVHSFLWSGSV